MFEHLAFLNHGESKSNDNQVSSYFEFNGKLQQEKNVDERAQIQKQADVIEYLQQLPRGTRATASDFLVNVEVDVQGKDSDVLDMLRHNPKIEIFEDEDILLFKYRSKFEIRNRFELLNVIDKVSSGISRSEIQDCYPDIDDDISDAILNGDIIAVKNRENRNQILYPRGKPFFTKLSGTVIANPSSQAINISEDLRQEIRRGDAILIGGSWYRVSSMINSSQTNQPARAKAPLSVTSVDDLSSKNEYISEFNERSLPIDGEIETAVPFTGRALKHGCTNDVREKWKKTMEDMKKFRDEKSLQQELLHRHLITKIGPSTIKKNSSLADNNNRQKKRVRRTQTKLTNIHLVGTAVGSVIEAAAKAAQDAEN